MNLFLIALAFAMAIFCFFYRSFKYDFYRYSWIIWLVVGLFRLMFYRKYLQFIISDKPILIVNEFYIEDLAQEIRYHWKDIDQVYEDNGTLFIKLYNNVDYAAKMGGLTKKIFSGFISRSILMTNGTPFVINIDAVNVNPNALLQILDDYSAKPEEIDSLSEN
jgi:hypothetical protein